MSQNLLRNPGFEEVPNGFTGQGLIASEWSTCDDNGGTPDTYSNDGSYGLPISTNFNDTLAHGGIRYMSGWALVPETINQSLSAVLEAGQTYTVSAFLHQAFRPDLNISGGYDIALFTDPSFSSRLIVGHIGDTTNFDSGWNQFSTTFVAPADSSSRGIFGFVPSGTNGSQFCYPGIDDVSLTSSPVPEPGVLAGLGLGLVGVIGRRRRCSMAVK
jgi:hypothetical protein